MYGRNYGIPPGYQEGQDHTRQRQRRVSPTNLSEPSSSDDRRRASARSVPVTFQTRHTERRPILTDEKAPAPPPHRQVPSSPTRQRAYPSLAGFPVDLADTHLRDGRVDTLRDIDNLFSMRMMSPSPEPDDRPSQRQYSHMPPKYSDPLPSRPPHQSGNSQSSIAPLIAHRSVPLLTSSSHPRVPRVKPPIPAAVVGDATHRIRSPSSFQGDGYDDDYINPNDIADDADDDISSPPLRRHRTTPEASPVEGGPTVGGTSGAFRMFDRSRRAGNNYDPVPGGSRENSNHSEPEKSEWLQRQSSGNRRLRWIVGSVIAMLVTAAIAGGVAGGILGSQKNNGSTGGISSSTTSTGKQSLYDINSPEVTALLNNNALHRVFPGMDYTPLNTQYPDCLTNPPDQNNITLDVAMLAQLTPAIRLYGTDCNQTEMLLTAISVLGYNASVKVWMGVWLDSNSTTNARQLQQMYNVLNTYPADHFAGIIVGNEVLYREDMDNATLGQQLQDVRANLTTLGITLPVATSDLGDDWTAGLAANSDIVMANVHPFFAGVTPDVAPAWAWSFWDTHDVVLTAGTSTGTYPKNIISEIGWPSDGGNDCGTTAACPNSTAGAVASVDDMNTFMEGWVCQALTNGTTYFWFEAFDEPWKVIYNTPTDQWESKWGLMDADRNLKSGLQIPDCGGQTVDKPY